MCTSPSLFSSSSRQSTRPQQASLPLLVPIAVLVNILSLSRRHYQFYEVLLLIILNPICHYYLMKLIQLNLRWQNLNPNLILCSPLWNIWWAIINICSNRFRPFSISILLFSWHEDQQVECISASNIPLAMGLQSLVASHYQKIHQVVLVSNLCGMCKIYHCWFSGKEDESIIPNDSPDFSLVSLLYSYDGIESFDDLLAAFEEVPSGLPCVLSLISDVLFISKISSISHLSTFIQGLSPTNLKILQ
jgi:hypothetical protein